MPKLKHICIGEVLKPQGLAGEIKVKPATDDPERFMRLKSVFIDHGGELREFAVVKARLREGFAYLFLEGITDISDAEKLRGLGMYVERANAQRLPKGRYFIAELIGCRVLADSGAELGELCDISQAGGNDVYTIKRPDGGRTMFPAVKDAFVSVDIEAGEIVLSEKRLREVAVNDD